MSNNSNAITVRNEGLLPAAQDWQTMSTMATEFVKSGLLPDSIKTPQAAMVIMQKGRELGLPPMAALSGISVIKGKPVASAELMLSLIYRDHGDDAIHIIQTDAQACRVRFKRRTWKAAQEFAFTLQDAATAGLTNGNTWKQYPAAMLRARCISAVARMTFPDSIAGMYLADEMGSDAVEPEWREVPQVAPQATPSQRVDSDTGEITSLPPTTPQRLPDKLVLRLEELATEADVGFAQMSEDAVARYQKRDYTWLSVDEAKDYAVWLKSLVEERAETEAEQELIEA